MNEKNLGPFHFKRCMTVRELKEIINSWPEENGYGDANEVMIETGADQVSRVTSVWSDTVENIMFMSNTFDDESDVLEDVQFKRVN